MTILNLRETRLGPLIESKTSCGSNSVLAIDCCGWGLRSSATGLPEYRLQDNGRDTALRCRISDLLAEVLI
jgi:hypothetical protein